MSVTGKFRILLHGKLYEYTRLEDVPQSFDNLIAFLPDYPPEPHTQEQHEQIEKFVDMLHDLLKRETK
jgi:hypothetical protein